MNRNNIDNFIKILFIAIAMFGFSKKNKMLDNLLQNYFEYKQCSQKDQASVIILAMQHKQDSPECAFYNDKK